MKRIASLIFVIVLAATSQAFAAGLISKTTAEQDALNAVGGGTVTLAALDNYKHKTTWSVDITGSAHDYEVQVDAHSGAILLILTQPLAPIGSATISKTQAETDALNAVGGGTVLQAVRDTYAGKQTWSVDVAGTAHEYEVQVDAHSGAILKIITQPLAPTASGLISKSQAETDAQKAVGGGTILQAVLETDKGKKIWSVDVAGSAAEYEVHVDAHTGAILLIITQPLNKTACKFISKATANSDALAAVGGGTVLRSVLESQDNPPVWSVDVLLKSGSEDEVKVNACTGSIVAIIPGG